MDLMESLRILRARWILTSTLLLLTLAACVAAVVKLPWTYQANASTVLLASKNFAKTAGGNRYLAFDPSLTLTADVVRRELMDPRTALALAAAGYPNAYQVVAATDTTGPVLLITVTGSNKVTVEHTLQGVTAQVATKLLALQSGISPANQINSLVVSMSPTATLSVGKKAKPLVVLLAGGLVLTYAIPQVVNARAVRRRSRREVRAKLDETGYGDTDYGDNGTARRRDVTYPREPAPLEPAVAHRDGRRGADDPVDARRALEPDGPLKLDADEPTPATRGRRLR
jgi:hypothetical protein